MISRTASRIVTYDIPSDSAWCVGGHGPTYWDLAPTPPAPGTKRCWPCASWSTWGPLTGLYGVSADLLGLPDPEFVIGWDLAPTPLGPGTKRCCPCASWSTWGPLSTYYGYGVSVDSFRKVCASYFSTHMAAWSSMRGVQQWQKESYLILKELLSFQNKSHLPGRRPGFPLVYHNSYPYLYFT